MDLLENLLMKIALELTAKEFIYEKKNIPTVPLLYCFLYVGKLIKVNMIFRVTYVAPGGGGQLSYAYKAGWGLVGWKG